MDSSQIVEKITKDEYVDTIKLMMEKQDMYLMWFLGFLSLVLVFVGVLQWRLSNKQIEQLKAETKKESRKEIIDELIKSYGINEFRNIQSDTKEIGREALNLNIRLNDIEFKMNTDFNNQVNNIVFNLRKVPNPTLDLYTFILQNQAKFIISEKTASLLSECLEHAKYPLLHMNTGIAFFEQLILLLEDIREYHNNDTLFKETINEMRKQMED